MHGRARLVRGVIVILGPRLCLLWLGLYRRAVGGYWRTVRLVLRWAKPRILQSRVSCLFELVYRSRLTNLIHLILRHMIMMLRDLIRWQLVISWHNTIAQHGSVKLLRRLSKWRRRCALISVLHSITKLRNTHWSVLRNWSPARLLLRREKRGVLGPDIKAFIISTLLSRLSSLTRSRPVLN
jgi:hypothetical protein